MPPRAASSRPAPPAARYGGVAIALHWLLAAALAATFLLGLWMVDLPFSPRRIRYYNWHKWAGMVILALSLVRLAWRLAHPPPPDAPMPAWQAAAARLTHRLMYALFLAVPLSGWAYSSAAGFPVVVFGVLPLPDLVPVDRALAARLASWHAWSSYLLAAAAVLHTAAALKHHFVDRDGLVGRMWPGRG